jgi:hypothetical protein
MLKALPRVKGKPFVIIGKREKADLIDLQDPWRRIRKAAGLNDVRIHDLRHTFASGGLLVGEELAMIGNCSGAPKFRPQHGMRILRPIRSNRWLRRFRIASRQHFTVHPAMRAPCTLSADEIAISTLKTPFPTPKRRC